MPVLSNPRWEAFAQALAKGKTQEEAYEAAGYKPSRHHASRLATNGNVQARLAELQEKAAERALVTIESLTDELEEARLLAMKEGQPSAAAAAVMGKARLHGKLVDKAEVTVNHRFHDLSDAEILTELTALLGDARPENASKH